MKNLPISGPSPAVSLLLADCKRIDGTPLPLDGLLACWDPGGGVGMPDDSLFVRCEPFEAEDGSVVPSLWIRAYFYGDDLKRAVRERTPIPVVAYWRRHGFAWSRRSARFARRFRLGVGGSLMATLVPLLDERP